MIGATRLQGYEIYPYSSFGLVDKTLVGKNKKCMLLVMLCKVQSIKYPKHFVEVNKSYVLRSERYIGVCNCYWNRRVHVYTYNTSVATKVFSLVTQTYKFVFGVKSRFSICVHFFEQCRRVIVPRL